MFNRFPCLRQAASILLCVLSVSVVTARQPVFKSGAERVTVAVVARDRNSRPMTGLSAADFEILDDGQRRSILDFRSDASAVTVALLLDTSGSMRLPPKLQLSTDMGRLVLAAMSEGIDEAGLFVFDKTVRMAHPFTTKFESLRSSLAAVHPFGSTSLYDAIAATAQQVSTRPGRRALVVLTDGIDTSSQLTATRVSGIASAIDMPVYVVAVGRLTDDLKAERTGRAEDAAANLSDLARWSGGAFFAVASAADGSIAARQIVTDLRHQYLIAFEPHSSPGWHRIEVRARQRLTLQARSGYWVAPVTAQQ
jgi:Ca-activated chloride channel homolog